MCGVCVNVLVYIFYVYFLMHSRYTSVGRIAIFTGGSQ